MTKKLNFYQESFDSNLIKEEFSFYLKEKLHFSDKDIFIHNDRLLSKVEENLIKDFFKQKKEGIPLDYILNSTKFYDSDFYVDSRVLIPRPETELLIEPIMKIFKNRSLFFLETCLKTALDTKEAKKLKKNKAAGIIFSMFKLNYKFFLHLLILHNLPFLMTAKGFEYFVGFLYNIISSLTTMPAFFFESCET